MATRTIQFMGLAYGANTAAVTATADGTTIFTGTVSTLDQAFPELPNPALASSMIPLFTLEIDTSFAGQIPVTIESTSGNILIGVESANYTGIYNPVYTPEQITVLTNPATPQVDKVAIYESVANPALSQQDIDTLLDPASTSQQRLDICEAHNITVGVSSGPSTYVSLEGQTDLDPKSNISINGVPQSPDYDELPGPWWWTIIEGSTLSYDLNVEQGSV